jgi:hypothetical protein
VQDNGRVSFKHKSLGKVVFEKLIPGLSRTVTEFFYFLSRIHKKWEKDCSFSLAFISATLCEMNSGRSSK